MAKVLTLAADARKKAISELCAQGDVAGLKAVVEAAADDSVLLANSKPAIAQVVEYAADENTDGNVSIQLCDCVVQAVAKRISSFGEEAVRSREVLADVYECSERKRDAIVVLQGMPMEHGLRSSTDEYKASCWIRVAQLSLDVDNSVQAETYINRAWPLMKNVTDENLKLHFYTCFATISDINRKFIDAGQRFYQLSQQLEDGIGALRKAIVCAFLADAGPRRARLLTMLNRDERLPTLGDLNIVLSKVYHNRVLRDKDVALIKPYLLTHHKATNREGRTVFDLAIIQHNLQAASKLYYNITFNELGNLLAVTPDAAEKIAAQMIAEDRLKATIDQLNEVIWFISDSDAPIQQWDKQIGDVCNAVASAADTIAKAHPAIGALLEK